MPTKTVFKYSFACYKASEILIEIYENRFIFNVKEVFTSDLNVERKYSVHKCFRFKRKYQNKCLSHAKYNQNINKYKGSCVLKMLHYGTCLLFSKHINPTVGCDAYMNKLIFTFNKYV